MSRSGTAAERHPNVTFAGADTYRLARTPGRARRSGRATIRGDRLAGGGWSPKLAARRCRRAAGPGERCAALTGHGEEERDEAATRGGRGGGYRGADRRGRGGGGRGRCRRDEGRRQRHEAGRAGRPEGRCRRRAGRRERPPRPRADDPRPGAPHDRSQQGRAAPARAVRAGRRGRRPRAVGRLPRRTARGHARRSSTPTRGAAARCTPASTSWRPPSTISTTAPRRTPPRPRAGSPARTGPGWRTSRWPSGPPSRCRRSAGGSAHRAVSAELDRIELTLLDHLGVGTT